MDVLDSPHQGLAQVLSLSLHRLQHAPPRVFDRALVSRSTVFRPLRNVKGVFHADGFSFLKDRAQTELCAVQMIARSDKSILFVSDGRDASLLAAVEALQSAKPNVIVQQRSSPHLILIVDERVALMARGGLGVCLEGEIAREIAADLGCGVSVSAGLKSARAPWPFRTRLDLENIAVGFSRTLTERGRAPVIEIERLCLIAIKRAKRFIYFEVDRMTSPLIARAIRQSLKLKEGPEFVFILPPSKPREILQTALIASILDGDSFGRFHAFERPSSEPAASLMIVDDQFVKIGTSSLTSRSLSVSRELDFSVEALGRPHIVTAIARLRRERIGRLLGLDPAEFDARFLLNGSLAETLRSFFTVNRDLRERRPVTDAWAKSAVRLAPFLDPKRPAAFRWWFSKKLRLAPKWQRFASFLLIFFVLSVMFASLFARAL